MLSIRCKKRSSQLSHPEPSRYKMASASAKWFSLMWEGRRNAAFHCNSPCPRTFGGSLILDLISFTCKDVPYKNPIVVGQFGRHYLDLILVEKCALLGHRLFENPQRFKLLFHQRDVPHWSADLPRLCFEIPPEEGDPKSQGKWWWSLGPLKTNRTNNSWGYLGLTPRQGGQKWLEKATLRTTAVSV